MEFKDLTPDLQKLVKDTFVKIFPEQKQAIEDIESNKNNSDYTDSVEDEIALHMQPSFIYNGDFEYSSQNNIVEKVNQIKDFFEKLYGIDYKLDIVLENFIFYVDYIIRKGYIRKGVRSFNRDDFIYWLIFLMTTNDNNKLGTACKNILKYITQSEFAYGVISKVKEIDGDNVILKRVSFVLDEDFSFFDLDEVKELNLDVKNGDLGYYIYEKKTQQRIGFIWFRILDRSWGYRSSLYMDELEEDCSYEANLQFYVLKKYRDKGYGTEAIKALTLQVLNENFIIRSAKLNDRFEDIHLHLKAFYLDITCSNEEYQKIALDSGFKELYREKENMRYILVNSKNL